MADFDVVGDINLQFRAGALQRITRELGAALSAGVAQVRGFNQLGDLNRILTDLNANSQRVARGLTDVAAANARLASSATANASAMSRTSVAMQQVDRSAKQASTSVQRVDDKMKSLRNSLRSGFTSKIGYMILGGVGSLIGLQKGLNAAIEFERILVKIRQVTDESAASVRGFAKDVNSLAVAWGVNSKELIESAEILAQAGFSLGQVKDLMKTVARTQLAPTFGDARSVTEGMIAVMRQFRLEAYQVEEAMGAINQVSAQYSVESDDIISAVRRTGAVFSSMGGNLNELIAVFSTIRETTREAPEAIATGLRTILTRLKRPATINLFEAMGVDLTEGEGQFKRPLDMIRAIGRALESAGGGRNMFVAQLQAELGGIRQAGRLIPLLENIDKVEEILSVAEGGGKSLFEDQAIAMKSLTREVESLKESFQQLYNTIAMSDAFRELVHLIGVATKNMTQLAIALEPLYPFFFGMGSVAIGTLATKFIKRQTGGIIPGSGVGDHIPILAEPGEFMINKRAAKRIGYDRLAKMNMRGYQDGGVIGGVDAAGDVNNFGLNTIFFVVGALGAFLKALKKNTEAMEASAKAQQETVQKAKQAQQAEEQKSKTEAAAAATTTANTSNATEVVPERDPSKKKVMPSSSHRGLSATRRRKRDREFGEALDPASPLLPTTRGLNRSRSKGRRLDTSNWQQSTWTESAGLPPRQPTPWEAGSMRRGREASAVVRRRLSHLGRNIRHTFGMPGVGMLGSAAMIAGNTLESSVKPTNVGGRAASRALTMGGIGAIIGSTILPGFGTAIGAAVGSLYGFTTGLKDSIKAIEAESQQRRVGILRDENIGLDVKLGELNKGYGDTFKGLSYKDTQSTWWGQGTTSAFLGPMKPLIDLLAPESMKNRELTSSKFYRESAAIPQEDILRIMKEDFKRSGLSYNDYINTEQGKKFNRMLGAGTVQGKRYIEEQRFGLVSREGERLLGGLGQKESRKLLDSEANKMRESAAAFVDSSQLIDKALESVAQDLEYISVTFRATERRIINNATAVAKGQTVNPESFSDLLSPGILARGGGDLGKRLGGLLGVGGTEIAGRLTTSATSAEQLKTILVSTLESVRSGGVQASELSTLEDIIADNIGKSFRAGSQSKGFAQSMAASVFEKFSQNRQADISEIPSADISGLVNQARDDLIKPTIEQLQLMDRYIMDLNKAYVEEAENVQFLTKAFGDSKIAYIQASDEVYKLERALRNEFVDPLKEARRQIGLTAMTVNTSRTTSAPNAQAFLSQRGVDLYGGLAAGNVGSLLTSLMSGLQNATEGSGGIYNSTDFSLVLKESQNAIKLEIDNRKTLNQALMTEAELLQSEINSKRGDLLNYLGSSPEEQRKIMERRRSLENFVGGGANFGALLASSKREEIIGEIRNRNPNERVRGTTIGALREGLLRYAEARPELATFDTRALQQEMNQNIGGRRENTEAIRDLTQAIHALNTMNRPESGVGARGINTEVKFLREFNRLWQATEKNMEANAQTQAKLAENTNQMAGDIREMKGKIAKIATDGIKVEHMVTHGPTAISITGGEGLEEGIRMMIDKKLREVFANPDVPALA